VKLPTWVKLPLAKEEILESFRIYLHDYPITAPLLKEGSVDVANDV
jgi:hypothetical protein